MRAQVRGDRGGDEGVGPVDQEAEDHEEPHVDGIAPALVVPDQRALPPGLLVDEEHGDGHHQHAGAGGGRAAAVVGQQAGSDAAHYAADVEQRREVGGVLGGDLDACGEREREKRMINPTGSFLRVPVCIV